MLSQPQQAVQLWAARSIIPLPCCVHHLCSDDARTFQLTLLFPLNLMSKSYSHAADKGVPVVICLKNRSVKAENE